MVAVEHRTGLYVTIPIYFVFLLMATYWAHKRMETMKHAGVADSLTAHYLGGRSFGPFLTAGTIFASFFSGYTVRTYVMLGLMTLMTVASILFRAT